MEHRQALMLAFTSGCASHQKDVLGEVRVGAPRLLAVDQPPTVDLLGAATQISHVGARFGFGHRDRLRRATDDPAEHCLLLGRTAELLVCSPGDDGRAESTDRRHALGGFLQKDAQVDRASGGSAVFLRDSQPEPSQFRHLLVERLVVVMGAMIGQQVSLLTGTTFLLAERRYRLGEIRLLLREIHVHRKLPSEMRLEACRSSVRRIL